MDIYGQCADYGPIAEICGRYDVPVIDVDWRPPPDGVPRLTQTRTGVSIDDANAEAVRGGMAQLSPSSRFTVIPGSVHAFFGRYGPQGGDGLPTVSRADAEAAILAEVGSYLGEVR